MIIIKAQIDLMNVSKIYNTGDGELYALNDVSIKIYSGEFISIVGQSGSGKSTMMNILGCLDVPTRGKYFLQGENVCEMNENSLARVRNERIGFIFQGFNLIPGLTALENVELPLMYRGVDRAYRRELAYESLERVGLSKRVNHLPSQMSGGQQQRVAIARAIAARPPIILADEPTGNLDSKSGNGVVEILKELNRDGRTVILITHDNNLALEAQRMINISDGKIVSLTGENQFAV